MGNPLYRDYERLVNITVLGKAFQVPEKNTCLRVFQYMSPETIPYGRFCWNQECQLCRISYTMASQPDALHVACWPARYWLPKGCRSRNFPTSSASNLMGVIGPPNAPLTAMK